MRPNLTETAMHDLVSGALLTLALSAPASVVGATTAVLESATDGDVAEGRRGGSSGHPQLIQVGVGRVGPNQSGEMLGYVRFYLGDVPPPTLFRDTVIERATLSLFAQGVGLPTPYGHGDRFFVSVTHCPDNVSEVGDDMSWTTRPCPGLRLGDDATIVEGVRLPQLYRWDVTRSIRWAIKRDRRWRDGRWVTFILSAFKLEAPPGAREIVPGQEFGPLKSVGFVRFSSREQKALSAAAIPRLRVVYSRVDTRLMQFVTQFGSTVLAILSAFSLALGVWETLQRFRRKRIAP